LSEETVEPLARVLRADVENLQPFRRNEWSVRRSGLDRRIFRLVLIALGRTA
jgi:hypothetical protein